MFDQAHQDTMRSSYADILAALKRSDGMPISDLSRELGKSYMGIKQHCLKLTEMGYLEEWRVPREKKEVGRPEKLYRLTRKCDSLFPSAGVELSLSVLESVKSVYGESAPEKLLFHHFHQLQERWLAKVRAGKSMVEKATRLADVRDKEGWFSRCHYDPESGFRIEEFHNPLAKIYEVYPNAVRMEVQMMEKVLGTRIVRKIAATGKGRKRVIYEIATLGVREDGGATRPAMPEIKSSGQGRLF
ncbi:MAG: helix-turn-helix transcriptional regulator [Verrucomicrobiaceae bacterium]